MSLSCSTTTSSCPGIRFPDGSDTVPQDTVGTKSEQDAKSTMTTLMVALVLISAGSVGYWQFAVYKRKHMLRDANEAVLLAVEAKAKAIRQKMDEQSWPKHWKMKAGAAQAQGDGEPEEGLIELDPSEEEYWEVHECLRRETECGQGQMADAWLVSACTLRYRRLALNRFASNSPRSSGYKTREPLSGHTLASCTSPLIPGQLAAAGCSTPTICSRSVACLALTHKSA